MDHAERDGCEAHLAAGDGLQRHNRLGIRRRDYDQEPVVAATPDLARPGGLCAHRVASWVVRDQWMARAPWGAATRPPPASRARR
jgi:hypothetical protein